MSGSFCLHPKQLPSILTQVSTYNQQIYGNFDTGSKRRIAEMDFVAAVETSIYAAGLAFTTG
jgi:hypothetical protein